jgi:hypothetical protein
VDWSASVGESVEQQNQLIETLDWPGWCRAGRDESTAMEALASYAKRHARVAERAGISLPSILTFDVVERVPGGPTTAFAAPECRRPFPQVTAEAERAGVIPAAAQRLVRLVTAGWATFDEVVAASPAVLRKGPRGGGRDRDEIVDHVIGAETAYARKLGVEAPAAAIDDMAAVLELREAIAVVSDQRRVNSWDSQSRLPQCRTDPCTAVAAKCAREVPCQVGVLNLSQPEADLFPAGLGLGA